MMHFLPLPRESYEYHELHYTYTSGECYRVQKTDGKEEMSVSFVRETLAEEIRHDSYDTLYQPYWQNCKAYGVTDESGELVGILELDREEWNSRLRITQLLVKDTKRRKGIGSFLIDKAKEIARQEDFRLIVLETQSCNINAIDFYRSCGFVFAGTNLYFYSNDDIAENEVMLELSYLF